MAILTANNQSLTEITSLPSVVTTGSMVLLATETASSSDTLDFTSGIDDTYDEYVFKFIDIHVSAEPTQFSFNGSIDSGDNYNVSKTTTCFSAYHDEADTATNVDYRTAEDVQGTGFQMFQQNWGTDNDQNGAGTIHLFKPSSTTFVKHFIARSSNYHNADYAIDVFVSGYFNTTSAIDAIQFKMSSGTIDAGTIKMYGVS